MTTGFEKKQLRILVAKPGIDSHWIGAMYLATELRNAGFEAIYTGLFQSPEMIVNSALQEDVDAIALSMLGGQHIEIAQEVLRLLKEKSVEKICVFGGGVIPERDKPLLEEIGVTGNFGPGTSTEVIIQHMVERISKTKPAQ